MFWLYSVGNAAIKYKTIPLNLFLQKEQGRFQFIKTVSKLLPILDDDYSEYQ